ncbi:MAG: flippase [Candidatus Thorarchaeota archaeon]
MNGTQTGSNGAATRRSGATTRRPSIKRNAFFSAITNGADALQFLLILLAGKVLGTAGLGSFCFALSTALVFLTISDFGLNTMTIRDVARDRSRAPRYLANILSWKVILSIVAFCLLLVASVLVWDVSGLLFRVIVLLGLAAAFRFFALTARCFFHAFERFNLEALAVTAEQLLLLAAGAVALWSGYGVLGLAAAFLAVRIMGCGFIYALLGRTVPLSVRLERRFIADLQIQAAPIGVALLVSATYVHIDTFFLKSMATLADVGLYNSAYRMFVGLFMVPSIICTVLLPRLSSTYRNPDKNRNKTSEHKAEFNMLMVRGAGFLFLAAVPFALVGLAFPEEILKVAFSSDFIEAGSALRLLLITCLISFQVWFLRNLFIAVDQQRALMNFQIAGLACRAICNMVLIPRFGILGAAMATFTSETLLFVGMWAFLFLRLLKVRNFREALEKAKRSLGR